MKNTSPSDDTPTLEEQGQLKEILDRDSVAYYFISFEAPKRVDREAGAIYRATIRANGLVGQWVYIYCREKTPPYQGQWLQYESPPTKLHQR
jgi:hypothetical protein